MQQWSPDSTTTRAKRRCASKPDSEASPWAALFAQGDYAGVAQRGDADSWHTYAALGLIGKTREAVAGLERFDHDDARFHAAVAHWIGGQDDAAMALLESLSSSHARNLLTLLRKPSIDVLAQWPWRRDGCSDLLTGAAADGRFRVRNLSFHPDDLPNKPYADVHEYYDADRPPDFYVCAMVEWHLVPPNLTELPCPLFGQTGDYDLHVQTVLPWLRQFDALLVTDPSEWSDVRRLVRAPVHVFPKSFGVPRSMPPPRETPRDIDVHLSGTMLHPYHPDKAQLLHQLLKMPDLHLKVVNGFKTEAEYHDDLARSKICITYVRHPTALPTRGLEALAMGCAVIVQRDSVLTLFVGPEQGVLTYQLEDNDLPTAVRHVVRNWPEFAERAAAGAWRVRNAFDLKCVASQYLRFLTYLAAQPRAPRSLRTAERLYHKRSVLHKGWLPSDAAHDSPILRSIAVKTHRRLQEEVVESASPHARLDLAREVVLANYHRAEDPSFPASQWLAYLRDTYRTARERFPHSLVARFNGIRAMLHFGTPKLVGETLALLDETLALPTDHWRVDVMEDVFPWDFFPQFFNYRGYFDRVMAHLTDGADVEADLCRLMRASLFAYRGFHPTQFSHHSRSLDDYEAAVALDPEFPYFRLWHADQLARRGLPEDRETAFCAWRALADGSLVFQEARQRLENLGAYEDVFMRGRDARARLDVRESVAVPKLRPTVAEAKRIERETKAERETLSWQREREHLYRHIRAIESTKFWKLRQAWFGLKRRLGLVSRDTDSESA